MRNPSCTGQWFLGAPKFHRRGKNPYVNTEHGAVVPQYSLGMSLGCVGTCPARLIGTRAKRVRLQVPDKIAIAKSLGLYRERSGSGIFPALRLSLPERSRYSPNDFATAIVSSYLQR
jgi:hypothetical protein